MSNRDLDALFTLPLAEFTAARNALVKRLKQEKRNDEAERIKALSKPSVSAWSVNQLYWKHREEFDQLLDAGVRLQEAHASQLTGKAADVRGAMEARRLAVSTLLRRADTLLNETGHSSTPDTMRRIETTLEAISTSSSVSETFQLGRLTEDVEPLGFDSMVALAPNLKPVRADKENKENRDAALRAAEQTLREAEERLSKAQGLAEEAHRRLRELRLRSERADKAVQEAEEAVESARNQLRQVDKP